MRQRSEVARATAHRREKVVEGFRYFTAPIEALVAAFESGDLAAIEALPYALDDDGDQDTTSVCLLLAYTDGGAFLAAQPQEYATTSRSSCAGPITSRQREHRPPHSTSRAREARRRRPHPSVGGGAWTASDSWRGRPLRLGRSQAVPKPDEWMSRAHPPAASCRQPSTP